MREIIIERIKNFKVDEDNFKSKWWVNHNVSFTQNNLIEVKHISSVDFNLLNDEDLVRLFEYIILCKSDISSKRVRQTYFKS